MEDWIEKCIKPKEELLADKKKKELYVPVEQTYNYLPVQLAGKPNMPGNHLQ